MCRQMGWLHIPDLWLITYVCKGNHIPSLRASVGMPNLSPRDFLRGSVVMTVANCQNHFDTSLCQLAIAAYQTTPELDG